MKRAYDKPSPKDGFRILVDRLWPRGVKKEDLPYDYWAKDITPSPSSRQDFAHKAERMEDFRQRYLFELEENEKASVFISLVRNQLKEQTVTLVYAAKDPQINHVVILKAWLEEHI